MEDVKPLRDRRARRAEQTRQRIVDAAGTLFAARGYAGTTIEAIAAEADVAVETVYARFKNKRTLLSAYLDVAIVGDDQPVPLLDREEIQEVRTTADPREQVRRLAHLGRMVLERTGTAHAVLRGAAAIDPDAAALFEEDDRRRRATIGAYVEILAANAPLREGLSIEEAADTVSVLGSPDTYELLTTRRGWTPDRYEQWFATNVALILLPSP